MAGKNGLTVSHRVPFGVSDAVIAAWVAAARRRLPRHPGWLEVTAVGPAAMRQLNKHWRRKDKATNVLSFRLDHPATPGGHSGLWGQIVLCPATIKREAPVWNRTYRQHLRALVEHGLLHLYGLDHVTRTQQRQWNRYARRLLS